MRRGWKDFDSPYSFANINEKLEEKTKMSNVCKLNDKNWDRGSTKIELEALYKKIMQKGTFLTNTHTHTPSFG